MKKQSAKRRYKAANDSKIYFNWQKHNTVSRFCEIS